MATWKLVPPSVPRPATSRLARWPPRVWMAGASPSALGRRPEGLVRGSKKLSRTRWRRPDDAAPASPRVAGPLEFGGGAPAVPARDQGQADQALGGRRRRTPPASRCRRRNRPPPAVGRRAAEATGRTLGRARRRRPRRPRGRPTVRRDRHRLRTPGRASWSSARTASTSALDRPANTDRVRSTPRARPRTLK